MCAADSDNIRRQPTRLFGYDVMSRIGEGAGARIYVVRDVVSGRLYAMKHVRRRKKRDIRFVDQLQNELAMGLLVHHEGVRRPISIKIVRTFFRRVTEAALLLEYVEGVPLVDVTDMRVWEKLILLSRVARALAAMHSARVIHCDLKPSNILITSDRQPKLIDLGQACRLGSVKKRVQGTPGFMAPEQVHRHAVTERTDVFGFGATLYWVLTGRTIPTAMPRRRKDRLVKPSPTATPIEINPAVPQEASDLAMACVQQDMSRRPGSMSDVARQLELIGEEARRVYEAGIASASEGQ